MKFNRFIKISSIIPLCIFTLIFIGPTARASESGNDSSGTTPKTLNEVFNDPEQNDVSRDIMQEKNNANDSSPSPELNLSLNEKLQWFFSVDKPDFIDDPYENQDYDNYRATFGFHIVL